MKKFSEQINERLKINRDAQANKFYILNDQIKNLEHLNEMICSYLDLKVKESFKEKNHGEIEIPYIAGYYDHNKIYDYDGYYRINLNNGNRLSIFKLKPNGVSDKKEYYLIRLIIESPWQLIIFPMDAKHENLLSPNTNLLDCLQEIKNWEDKPTEILELFNIL